MTSEVLERLRPSLSDRYRVDRELGAGGMATVYLAHDLKHDRPVAIKVLHPELGVVLGAERFLSEIRTTANLQHPNILPLFDSGAVDGLVFYVMPYVEGETLRGRLAREGQLSVADAVKLAQGVASALDYAHRHGVIHRDIKPENILLQDGQALVADFGVALAVSNAGGARITQTGISVGTPQYMSPEQAAAERQLDGRSDQYSLAAVLYEMLAGEAPFTGPSAPAILTKLMTEQVPALSTRRPSVPGGLADAVHRALEKVPADRFATAAEFAEALTRERTATYRVANASGTSAFGWRALVAVAAIVVLAVTATGMIVLRWSRSDGSAGLAIAAKFQVQLPDGYRLLEGNPAVSPDGRLVVFVADSSGTRRLLMRDLQAGAVTPLLGTDGVSDDPSPPFFSPDGRWVAFVVGRRLLKVAITDAAHGVERVADLGRGEEAQGGVWGDNGWLVFGAGISRGLIRVREEGGAFEVIAEPSRARGEISYSRPEVLPGRTAVLFCLWTTRGWSLAVIDQLRPAAPRVLMDDVTSVRFLRTGHLLFSRADGLFVVEFDPRSLAVRGKPQAVARRLPMVDWGGGYYASVGVADDKTIAYVDQPKAEARSLSRWVRRLVLLDRLGTERPISDRSGDFVSFAPSGQNLATNDSLQITTYDLSRNGIGTRLTSGASRVYPVYSPDGAHLAYTSYETGAGDLYLMSAVDGGNATLLLSNERRKYPGQFTPDGKYLLYTEYDPVTAQDLWMLPMAGDRTPIALLRTPDRESGPAVSRDGALLAFVSNRSGKVEVYVQEFPASRTTQRVSTNGGSTPVWHPRRNELFYLENQRLMSVNIVQEGAQLRVGVPRQVLEQVISHFDVSPDGERFAAILPPLVRPQRVLTVVTNWQAMLREREP